MVYFIVEYAKENGLPQPAAPMDEKIIHQSFYQSALLRRDYSNCTRLHELKQIIIMYSLYVSRTHGRQSAHIFKLQNQEVMSATSVRLDGKKWHILKEKRF